MKRTLLWVVMLIFLSGCGTKDIPVQTHSQSVTDETVSPLEGYWMDESGTTLTFTKDEILFGNGLCYSYSIYDNNKFIFHDEDGARNYKFEIKNGDILEITNLNHIYNENDTATYYKSEDKQEEIKRNKLERERREASEASAEAERQAKEASQKEAEYHDYLIQQEYDAELDMQKTELDFAKEGLKNAQNMLASAIEYAEEYGGEPEEWGAIELESQEEISEWKERIAALEQRIELLENDDKEALWADSYSKVVDYLKLNVLPEDNSNDWIFLDRGLQQFYTELQPAWDVIGYVVEVRKDYGNHATLQGIYAMQMSTGKFYYHDPKIDGWNWVYIQP